MGSVFQLDAGAGPSSVGLSQVIRLSFHCLLGSLHVTAHCTVLTDPAASRGMWIPQLWAAHLLGSAPEEALGAGRLWACCFTGSGSAWLHLESLQIMSVLFFVLMLLLLSSVFLSCRSGWASGVC